MAEVLARRGACFFTELVSGSGLSIETVEDALWDLLGRGLVRRMRSTIFVCCSARSVGGNSGHSSAVVRGDGRCFVPRNRSARKSASPARAGCSSRGGASSSVTSSCASRSLRPGASWFGTIAASKRGARSVEADSWPAWVASSSRFLTRSRWPGRSGGRGQRAANRGRGRGPPQPHRHRDPRPARSRGARAEGRLRGRRSKFCGIRGHGRRIRARVLNESGSRARRHWPAPCSPWCQTPRYVRPGALARLLLTSPLTKGVVDHAKASSDAERVRNLLRDRALFPAPIPSPSVRGDERSPRRRTGALGSPSRSELFAFSVVSNHIHLVVRAPRANLPRFMQYLLTNVSKKVGKLVGWRGSFWERRYSAEPILDETALLERVRYVLSHGVKEGLVRRCREWPGLSCLPLLLDGQPRIFRWFDWTRRSSGNAHRAARPLLDNRWADPEELRLTPLPNPALQSRHALRSFLERSVSDRGTASRQFRAVLGRAGVLKQRPQARPPAASKRKPRPPCHTSIPELLEAFPRALSNVRRAVSQSIGPMEERQPDGFVPRSGNQTVRVAELRSDASRRLKLESRLTLTGDLLLRGPARLSLSLPAVPDTSLPGHRLTRLPGPIVCRDLVTGTMPDTSLPRPRYHSFPSAFRYPACRFGGSSSSSVSNGFCRTATTPGAWSRCVTVQSADIRMTRNRSRSGRARKASRNDSPSIPGMRKSSSARSGKPGRLQRGEGRARRRHLGRRVPSASSTSAMDSRMSLSSSTTSTATISHWLACPPSVCPCIHALSHPEDVPSGTPGAVSATVATAQHEEDGHAGHRHVQPESARARASPAGAAGTRAGARTRTRSARAGPPRSTAARVSPARRSTPPASAPSRRSACRRARRGTRGSRRETATTQRRRATIEDPLCTRIEPRRIATHPRAGGTPPAHSATRSPPGRKRRSALPVPARGDEQQEPPSSSSAAAEHHRVEHEEAPVRGRNRGLAPRRRSDHASRTRR